MGVTVHVPLSAIREHWQRYDDAKRYLASNHTTVGDRKEALETVKDFDARAGVYVSELVSALSFLVAYTDGEECADPDGCGNGRRCVRCLLRCLE